MPFYCQLPHNLQGQWYQLHVSDFSSGWIKIRERPRRSRLHFFRRFTRNSHYLVLLPHTCRIHQARSGTTNLLSSLVRLRRFKQAFQSERKPKLHQKSPLGHGSMCTDITHGLFQICKIHVRGKVAESGLMEYIHDFIISKCLKSSLKISAK